MVAPACKGCRWLSASKWQGDTLLYCAVSGANGTAIAVNRMPERICARTGPDRWEPRKALRAPEAA